MQGTYCVIRTKVTHDLTVVMTSLRYPIRSGRNNGYSQAVNFGDTQKLWEVCTYLGYLFSSQKYPYSGRNSKRPYKNSSTNALNL